MSTSYQTPWIQLGPELPAPVPRLLCVPYSAKGASQYRDWPGFLAGAAEVGAVQLPGREDRLTEKPVDRIDDLLAELVPAALPWLDRPFVVFGHCMGALISAELVLALRREHGVEPDAIVLSGAIPAWQDESTFDLSDLSDAELIRELRARGALQPRMLAEPALLTFMLPAARADSALCEDIRRRGRPSEPGLNCPLTLCAAQDDTRFSPEEMRGWSALTSGPVDLRVFEGDHTFMDVAPELVAATVRAELPSGSHR
ncbi:medium-chain acyl-[acyl-carrier-protein] hydrolase [Amycolatopsis marina]|uniref:Medium-chain acyl-[acyl-carrier-protein] hydrolase n=1 Tax=Amycolatopsis marina TaxID=490629 RepID=A0A1I0V7P9_9PSEU|nr:alpha/beta fold hydrolase [Amycolatopsis marina]SFA72067.1 medium-chain acyl-[acyl-carrier-protein] hydrolase [Amycolatopsis marina]